MNRLPFIAALIGTAAVLFYLLAVPYFKNRYHQYEYCLKMCVMVNDWYKENLACKADVLGCEKVCYDATWRE